jgi:hypothetical protein
MRNRVVWLMAALVVGLVASGPSHAQQPTNLIQNRNPGFESGVLTPWNAWGGGGATQTSAVVKDCVGAAVPEGPIEGNYCLYVAVSGPSDIFYQCSFVNQGPAKFEKGKKYTLSAFFKCKSGTGQIFIKPELAAPPYSGCNNPGLYRGHDSDIHDLPGGLHGAGVLGR